MGSKETTMPEPLPPIALYARLAEASASLARQIDILDTQAPDLAAPLEAAWLRLDDLIEQLPASLAWDAQHQGEGDA
jgi:hypothetical protein